MGMKILPPYKPRDDAYCERVFALVDMEQKMRENNIPCLP